jgi:hypothetical protein
MDRKRKIGLTLATLSIAIGAGHLVQQSADRDVRAAAAAPTAIVPLSARAQPEAAPAAAPVTVATAAPRRARPEPAAASPASAATAAPPQAAPAGAPSPAAPAPAAAPDLAAADPAPPATVPAAVAAAVPAALPSTPPAPVPAPQAAAPADTCAPALSAVATPGAVLSLALVAPCDGGARVVLRHGGLAVTGRLSGAGTLFTTLPGMEPAGEVTVLFPDGTRATAAAALDMEGIRRLAVQWQAEDAFALQVYENGAAFGAPGHVSAASPSGAGSLAVLGEAAVDLPLLAQVYTFPADATPVNVTVEAAVTAATCNRDLLGEVVETAAGAVTSAEITLAMPDCSGVGDFLVLNNLAGQTTLAAAD